MIPGPPIVTGPPCCGRKNPHLHHQGGVTGIQTEFSITVFLREGFIVPPVKHGHGSKYVPGDIAVNNDVMWHCLDSTESAPGSGDSWERLADSDKWKDRWRPYYNYNPEDIVIAAHRLYQCISGAPAGVHPIDSTKSASTGGRWRNLGRIGSKFPEWMDHYRLLSADVNIAKFLTVHSSTGLAFWNTTEGIIGMKEVPVRDQHPKVRSIFEKSGKTTVTQIYTLQSIHCGSVKPLPTEDDPDPEIRNIVGISCGAYMVPPDSVVPAGDNSADSWSPNSLMPLVSPQTGNQYTTIYMQFNAEDAPYIFQPKENPESLLSCILTITNREPHSKYTELFADCSMIAARANMIEYGLDNYKRTIISDSIRAGTPIPRDVPYAAYKEWERRRLLEKSRSIDAAEAAGLAAQKLWVTWLVGLRAKTEELRADAVGIEQSWYGREWINVKNPNRKAIKWSVGVGKGKTVITLQNVFDDINKIERIWNFFDHCVDGLASYYLNQIDKIVKNVRTSLKCYKSGGRKFV